MDSSFVLRWSMWGVHDNPLPTISPRNEYYFTKGMRWLRIVANLLSIIFMEFYPPTFRSLLWGACAALILVCNKNAHERCITAQERGIWPRATVCKFWNSYLKPLFMEITAMFVQNLPSRHRGSKCWRNESSINFFTVNKKMAERDITPEKFCRQRFGELYITAVSLWPQY